MPDSPSTRVPPATVAVADLPQDLSAPPPAEAPAPPRFLDPIPGVIPFGTVTIFAGAAGVGKTAMLAEWIVRSRASRPIWGHASNPATAYCYIAADRQWASHQRWLDLVGYSDIPRYSLADDPTFDLNTLHNPKTALALLPYALDRAFNGAPCPEGAHVIIDPISPIFIAGNPNSSRDVARTLLGLSRECQQRQINITCTAHFAKQASNPQERYQRPQDRIAGSGAFAGFSDTQIYLVDPEPPNQPWHLLGWVPRHNKPEEFTCTRDEHGLFTPYDVMREDEVASQIWDVLESRGTANYLTTADIVNAAFQNHGHSRSTVKRALDRLKSQGRAVTVGRGKWTSTRIH